MLVARDAEFTFEVHIDRATETKLALPSGLTDGKWFWRVMAMDEDGQPGVPSKVYAFTLGG